jgi:5-methylcytosine-specific restriction protein B
MHETTKDGLVYWLEFKDDDEFPAIFGSISGGSALKFGLYRRRETRAWMTGTPTAQREISTAEAVQMARAHRDQLLAADELLSRLPTNADDAAYHRLQTDLARVAPDVQDSAWGHKYLSLLHSDKLDDYHASAYQRFHLIKMLREPVDAQGRYVNAAKFVELGRLFSWPINHLATLLNRRNGQPHRYWRIGTTDGDQSYWDLMRDQSVAAIGWRQIRDLSAALADETFKETVWHVTIDVNGRSQGVLINDPGQEPFGEQPRRYVLRSLAFR